MDCRCSTRSPGDLISVVDVIRVHIGRAVPVGLDVSVRMRIRPKVTQRCRIGP